MDKTPLVSVIIPNYNHARYLDQRLQSVLGQTYPNFEVIILDDKSTDNSLEVIAKYQNDPHVAQVVVNEQNSGNTFKQWDKGISLAKGDIIWIAESDDFCELNMLEELVKAYTKKHGTVLAYAPTVFVDNDGKEFGAYSIEGREMHMSGDSFIKRYLTYNNGVYNASCAIFSKSAALCANPDYKTYRGIGDWWFWLYIAQQGNVAIVNKHLNYFRKHGVSVTDKRTVDGTNPRDIKGLLNYIFLNYHIPAWKKVYLLRYHRSCYRNIPYTSNDVKEEIFSLWNIDQKYTRLQKLYCRVLNHLQRRYLIRL